MKKITVVREFIAPEGFEFESNTKRIPIKGEWFLNNKGEPQEAHYGFHSKMFILKKLFTPQKGKLYMFWDEDSLDYVIDKFAFYNELYKTYHDDSGVPYLNISPIPQELVGK